MNGFTLMKESYQKLMAQGVIDRSEAEKNIRVYGFLETCDVDDFCIMVDSSAFNDIIKGYCEVAIKQGDTSGIFDCLCAKDALNRYYGRSGAMDASNQQEQYDELDR